MIILRSGDVIPKIIKVLTHERDGSELKYARPTNCPVCNSELLDEGVLLKCQNLSCEARVVNSIYYFASKPCLNIDGLGIKIVESNSDTDFIKKLYKKYDINLVNANRFINSKSSGRGKISEVLIRNKY